MTKEQALIRASAHYLTDPIPEEFFDWNELKQDVFLEDNAWQPFEEFPPELLYQFIDELALDMMNIAGEKKCEKSIDNRSV
jgi:hypothetical protein